MTDSQKRTPATIEKHRATIAELYLRQHTQQEIANKLGIDQATVSRDLKVIQANWRESALVDMNEAKQRELERIDQLEREYWQAWEASKKNKIKNRKTGTARKPTKDNPSPVNPESYVTENEERNGDPRFLQGVQWCIERRCKIIGVDAPVKTDLTSGGEKMLTWGEFVHRALNDSSDDNA